MKPDPWATPEMRETARLVSEVPRTRCDEPVWAEVCRRRRRMRVWMEVCTAVGVGREER